MIAGTLLASAVATALTTTLPSAELREWAWRVPFAVGTALCAAVATLRYRVDETPLFAQLQYSNGREARALWHAVRTHPLALLRAGALSVTGIVAYHVWLEFLPTYAHVVSNVDSHSAQLANTVALGMMLLCIPLCAMLSDRFGRRPTMLVAAIGIGVLVYPMLLGLNTGSPGFLIAQFGGAVLLSFDYANGPAIKAELFPTAVRAAGIGIPYSLAGAVFGSSASLITGYFAGAGQPLLFGGCITLACLINVIALVLMPETHNRALD
jgi:MHS family alpha-ketoglutarate permease-like MFS transporter